MKIKRLLLVAGIILLFIICFVRMNMNFDRLSRYPYDNEYARELIDSNLDNEQIEYIIEYSIAPNEFINYIEEPKFNIYHTSFYNEVKAAAWYLNDSQVVDFAESILAINAKEEAMGLLDEYYYNEVLYWLINHDIYNKNAILVNNPNSIEAYVDENYTISIRTPYLLVKQEIFNTLNDKEILIRDIMVEPLEQLYQNMKEELGSYSLFNLYLKEGYISFDDQKNLFEQKLSPFFPGHNEHQLGLAIDLDVKRGEFENTEIYKWLKENAYKYGFTMSSQDDGNKGHLRFVGYDLANAIHNNNSNLKKELSK